MFNIGGIQKTTLVDYPQKIAAIVFTQGCNFRCGYCHNPQLLEINSKKDIMDSIYYLINSGATLSIFSSSNFNELSVTIQNPAFEKNSFDFLS